MATSPNTSTLSPPKKKDESLLDKIGTLGRKKKVKEGRPGSDASENLWFVLFDNVPYMEWNVGGAKLQNHKTRVKMFRRTQSI